MINQQLLTYIHQQLSAGVAREEIKKILTTQGWVEQDVNEAFLAVEGGQVAPIVQPQMSTIQNVAVTSSDSKRKWPLVVGIILTLIILSGAGAIFAMPSLRSSMLSSFNLGQSSEISTLDSSTTTSATPPASVGTSSVPVAVEKTNTQAGISTKKTTVAPTAPTQSTTIPIKTADEIVIHGKAAKGIILNAKIRATEVIDGKMSGTAKEVEIGSSGDFSVSMPKGIILLQVVTRKGSIEKDEAIGVDVPLPLDFRFRAAVDLVDVATATKSVEVNITAYSEAAVVLAGKAGGLLQENINRANSGIANIFGVDFLSTKIIQSNDAVGLTNATQAEKKMAILNAAIAEMASTDKMGCGAMQTYGEIVNCTIAKFADQFSTSGW